MYFNFEYIFKILRVRKYCIANLRKFGEVLLIHILIRD